jgi:hypothetical protein
MKLKIFRPVVFLFPGRAKDLSAPLYYSIMSLERLKTPGKKLAEERGWADRALWQPSTGTKTEVL